VKRIGKLAITVLSPGPPSRRASVSADCDFRPVVPLTDTQRIQECHIMIGHIVCELIDETLGDGFPE